MVAPVTKSDARDAKKTAVPAHSSGLPQRPAGVRVMISWYRSGNVFTGAVMSVSSFKPPRCDGVHLNIEWRQLDRHRFPAAATFSMVLMRQPWLKVQRSANVFVWLPPQLDSKRHSTVASAGYRREIRLKRSCAPDPRLSTSDRERFAESLVNSEPVFLV